jgi:hypothetical protein
MSFAPGPEGHDRAWWNAAPVPSAAAVLPLGRLPSYGPPPPMNSAGETADFAARRLDPWGLVSRRGVRSASAMCQSRQIRGAAMEG